MINGPIAGAFAVLYYPVIDINLDLTGFARLFGFFIIELTIAPKE